MVEEYYIIYCEHIAIHGTSGDADSIFEILTLVALFYLSTAPNYYHPLILMSPMKIPRCSR
jgi:hypothetical protein